MRGAALLALGLAGCGVLARDHACWPYLEQRFGNDVPRDVVKQLARERRTRKRVGTSTAPIGAYWRPARPLSDEDVASGIPFRGAYRGWELVPCPGLARAHQARVLRQGGGPAHDAASTPQRPALPSDRRSRTVPP